MLSNSLLLRGGQVFLPNGTTRRADISVDDGVITGIGDSLPEHPRQHLVDVSAQLVLPGLIDAHRHMWLGALSASTSGVTLFEYARKINEEHGDPYTSEDLYAGVLWGAVQAINAGVTSIADWAHNLGSVEDIDANLRALVDSGVRARLFFGGKASSSGDPGRFEEHARQMRKLHAAVRSTRISLGLALRGPSMSSSAETIHDFDVARELGLPISLHAGMAGLPGAVAWLAGQDLVGPDVNYVHANEFSDGEWQVIADSGGTVTATPTVDLTMGLGVHPATGPALSHGVPVGLGADTVAYGPTDLFGEMRLVLATERARTNTAPIARGEMPAELAHGHLDVLRIATSGGARVLGLSEQTGQIAVGRRADLITVDLDAPHLDGFDDPVLAAFLGAGPRDVDTVIIDGRVLKRHGQLDRDLLTRAQDLLRASRERIKARRR